VFIHVIVDFSLYVSIIWRKNNIQSGDLEFESIGAHCDLSECKQHDFLPFKCSSCGGTFCLDHRTFDAHGCKKGNIKDAQAIFCPLCNQNVPVKPGEDPNHQLDEHIEKGCPPPSKARVNGCSVKGCKKKELMPIKCAKCRQNYCLRHRLEMDHNCTGAPPPKSKKTTVEKKSQSQSQKKTVQSTPPPKSKEPDKKSCIILNLVMFIWKSGKNYGIKMGNLLGGSFGIGFPVLDFMRSGLILCMVAWILSIVKSHQYGTSINVIPFCLHAAFFSESLSKFIHCGLIEYVSK